VRRAVTYLVLLLLAVYLLADAPKHHVATATDGGDEFVAKEVVVQLASTGDLPAIASRYSLDPNPLDQFGTRPIFRLRITDSASVQDRVNALSQDSRVVFVEPNFIAMCTSAPDPGELVMVTDPPCRSTRSMIDPRTP